MKSNETYIIVIGIDDKPLLKIIDKHFPNEEIYFDDGFLYGVVSIMLSVKNLNELYEYLKSLQITSKDIVSIGEVKIW